MPIRAMLSVPLAVIDPRLGMALSYLVAVTCLILTLRMLSAMVGSLCTQRTWDSLEIGVVTVFLVLHYILRDLGDAGTNLILLAILVGGVYCTWKGRENLSALWFGLAIAMKITPALLVPFLAWKRQWRLAARTSASAACWVVSPVLWMGPAGWWQQQTAWNRVAATSLPIEPTRSATRTRCGSRTSA